MKTRTIMSLLLLAFMALQQQAIAGNRSEAGFDKIRSLAGEWEATLPDGKKMRVTYQEINGGVIEERYRSEDPMWWNMSTVYHLDNDLIMMTHYCSWGNHPRMAASVPDGKVKELDFRFLDMTVTQPKNGYMKSASFEFQDNDHFTHHWVWSEKGEDRPLTLTMVRKKQS